MQIYRFNKTKISLVLARPEVIRVPTSGPVAKITVSIRKTSKCTVIGDASQNPPVDVTFRLEPIVVVEKSRKPRLE